MSRTLTGDSLVFLLLLAGTVTGKNVTETYSFSDVDVLQVNLTNFHERSPYIHEVSIGGNRSVSFNITNVSSSAAFMIFQIHVYQYNVTLAYDEESLNKVSNRSVYGSNVGLYSRLTGSIMTQFFVKNANPVDVQAIVIAIPYNAKAPVPGGCNMEFATEIAPYARVQTLPEMVIVDVQPPSMPLQSIAATKCGDAANPVSVDIYQMFLTEQDFSSQGYFSAISSMLTVQDIQANGREVPSAGVMLPMRRVFSAYTGVGSVYVAVANYGDNYTAYVPAFSYACHPVADPESCTILSGVFPQFVCALCLLIGVLLTIFSSQSLTKIVVKRVTLLFFGTVIGYMMVARIGIALLISLGLTALFDCLRLFSSLVGMLHRTVTMGFLCVCLLYYNTPDTFIAVHDNASFWTLFTVIACGVGVCTFCMSRISYMVTCSICAGLMVALPIDYYIGSNLKYIFINVIRRATVKDFHLASVQHPTQAADVILIVLWSCLAVYHFARLVIAQLSGTNQTYGSESEPLIDKPLVVSPCFSLNFREYSNNRYRLNVG